MLRLPAVAGSFYPSDATELSALIAEYRKKAEWSNQRKG